MPSNKVLRASIGEEAEAKGVDSPDTDGKNNQELAEILSGLKAMAPSPPSEEAAKVAEAEEAAKVAALPPYSVAAGKSVTTLKGIKADGEEVEAGSFPGGKETLDSLVDRGVVIKS